MESTISAAPQISIDREKTLRSHRRYWVLRRAQDIVFSLLALILLAPLALLISLAIVLDSPGDGAIFRQRRVGRDGKLFWLYKFRTMCPDAEEQLNELLSQNQMDGPVFKIKGDPRITRVGRFLRKTSLDELPQLLALYRYLHPEGWLEEDGSALTLYGREQFLQLGISLSAHSRRKACCACLDWSERRFHLGGEAGAALLIHLESKGWIQRVAGYREVVVTASGKSAITRHFSFSR